MKKSMRYMLVLLLSSGCGVEGPQGPSGPEGPTGPEGPMGSMGEPGSSPKALHLILRSTGEDLGFYVNSCMAFSEKLNGVVYYCNPYGFAYPEPGCKGTPMLQWGGPWNSAYVIGPTGTLLKGVGPANKFHEMSWSELRGGSVVCNMAEADIG